MRNVSRERLFANISVALAVGNVLWAGTACAQSSAGETAADETKVLPTISVTAERGAKPAFEVPAMVDVIAYEAIENRVPSSLDDVVGHVPGVSFYGGPRRTGEEPSIRGFSGTDVIVMVDGARRNFNSGHDGRIFLDPSFLREVEVVKGSGSALYGSGGTGGIIALRTVTADDFLDGEETIGARIGAGYGTNAGEGHGSTMVFAKPIEGLDLLGGFQYRKAGSIRLGADNGELDAKDDVRAGLAKGSYAFGDGHEVGATYQIYTNAAREPNNGQAATGTDADKDINAQSVALRYAVKPEDTPWLDLAVTGYRNSSTVDETEISGTDAGVLQTRDLRTLGVDFANTSRLTLPGKGALALTYGGEIYRDKAEGTFGGATRDGVVTGEQRFLGAFLQAGVSVVEPFGIAGAEFAITPAVRIDNYQAENTDGSIEETAVSPKVTTRLSPVPWGFVFGSYARAFRAPTLDEVFASGTHFAIGAGTNEFITNLDLQPQTTTTWEGGVGLEFEDLALRKDSLTAKTGYYKINGENFIDLEVTGPSGTCFFLGTDCGTSQSVNVEEARIWGVESRISYDTPRFAVDASYHHMETENVSTGEPLQLGQPDTYTVGATLKVPEVDLDLGWRMKLADTHDAGTDTDDHRDGYITHDVHAGWRPGADLVYVDGLTVNFAIDNVFNRPYERIASDVMEAGRDIRFHVGYTWRQ